MSGWDVIVAGGGPAGAAAAHLLARQGVRVLLCDPSQAPIEKVGEALPASGVALLRELGLPSPEASGHHRPIRGNLSAWGTPRLTPTDFIRDPLGCGWRLDRLRFDATLREAAVHSGAQLSCQRIVAQARARQFWKVRFADGGETSGRWLIDATGRAATLARGVGARRHYDPRLVALYAFGSVRESAGFDRTVLEAGPRGWWYAAWLPSGAPVAGWHLNPHEARRVGAERDGWRKGFAGTEHVRAKLEGAVFPSPVRVVEAGGARLEPFAADGWLACGDAALSFDPISGRGIQSALLTARLAAAAVSAELQGRGSAMPTYCEQLDFMRRDYLVECWRLYSAESRWPDEPFWAKRRCLALA